MLGSESNANIIVCDDKGDIISRSSERANSVIHNFGSDMIKDLYSKAEKAGGEHSFIFDFSDIAVNVDEKKKAESSTEYDQEIPPVPNGGIAIPEIPSENRPDKEQIMKEAPKVQRLIYVKIANAIDGESFVVIFDCSFTPIDTVSDTIRIQLIIVSVLIVFLSLCIAILFSRKVSLPIAKISENAKLLAEGKYDLHFEGGGCKEIDELSLTLNYASQELSKLEVMQNELISNISHDLRTPLTMIGGYAEVMRDIPGENTPENAQTIIDETKRLSALVNNLLEVSKLQDQAKILKCELFSLTQLISDTVSRFEKLVEGKGYVFSLDAKEDVTVYADKEKITQVLYNLIGNAINYTGEDKCIYVTQTTTESVVRVDVVDTGVGIAAEDLPHIWQRYYRANDFHKRSELGMGIGLSIVKDILDSHNAAFGVISTLGSGSDFWFKLHRTDRDK